MKNTRIVYSLWTKKNNLMDENLRPLLLLMGQNFSKLTELSAKNQLQERWYPLQMHLYSYFVVMIVVQKFYIYRA